MRRRNRRVLCAGIGVLAAWMLLPSSSMAATCDELTKTPGKRFGFGQPTVTSTSTLADGTNVTDVDVRVAVVHYYVEDVTLTLSHGATSIQLANSNGGQGDHYTNTVFDDSAATFVQNGSPPYTGTFKPEQPLSAFNGTAASGAWTLSASDGFPSADDGILANWSLRLTTSGDCPTNGDDDDDGVLDGADNCPNNHNPGQENSDPDALGDACDPDDDNDEVGDDEDNCRVDVNTDQANLDEDDAGDVCDPDDDGDGTNDDTDNCPVAANGDQANLDQDTLGDACDPDDDGDGDDDVADNCPVDSNEDQANDDGDGLGDVCDSDDDGDSIDDGSDSCPLGSAGGTDTDGDGCKDAGEDFDDDNDNVNDTPDECPLTAATTGSGCPEAGGTLTLKYKKNKETFWGSVASPSATQCEEGREVSIYRVVKGPAPDKRVGITTTDAEGYTLKKRAKPGKHYATVSGSIVPDVAACLEAQSSSIRL